MQKITKVEVHLTENNIFIVTKKSKSTILNYVILNAVEIFEYRLRKN